MQRVGLVLTALLAVCLATPVFQLLDKDDIRMYEDNPVPSRQRREEPPRWTGGGGGNGQQQSGWVKLQNPNGSGGGLSVFHHNGYGTDLGVNAMVPIWSRQGRYSDSTLNVGGGVSRHFGGPGGDRMLDKSVGINFVHRF